MAQQKAADGSQRYRGFLHALVTIPREEGLRAMWKGLLPRLMRIPPGQVWLHTCSVREAVKMQTLSLLPKSKGLLHAYMPL